MNSKAFYKLSKIRQDIEEKIESYGIDKLREKAKALPKKSQERKDLNDHINSILNSADFKVLKAELNLINRCINTVFYS